jgi:Ca2+-binding EF-hand superfamily protein
MLTELQKRKLMKLFCMYDAKNLGALKLNDFEQLAQRLADLRGWKVNTPAYEEILSRYVLFQWNRIRALVQQKLNRPHSSYIDLDEWLSYYDIVLNDSTYQDELMMLPEAVFNVVDADQSGLVDKDEWTDLFRVYNIPVIYVEETFNRIDVDGDGFLSKEEVLSMIQDFLYSSDPNKPGNYMFGPI